MLRVRTVEMEILRCAQNVIATIAARNRPQMKSGYGFLSWFSDNIELSLR